MGGERESASASCPSRTAGLARSRSRGPPAGRVQCEGSGRLPAGRPADGRARSLPPSANEFPIRSSAQLSTRSGPRRTARARTPRWLLAGGRPAGRLLGRRGGGVERRGRASEGNKWREAAFDAAVHRRWKECDRNRVDMADRPTDRPTTLSLSLSVQSTTRTTLARCGLEIPTTEFVVLVRSAIARRGKERRQLQMENGRKEEEGI